MNAVTWLGVVALGGVAWNVLTYSFKFGTTPCGAS